jgi:O-antigen/teichoic acid export membrane protein
MPNQSSLFGQAFRGGIFTSGGDLLLKISGITTTVLILAHLAPYNYGLWQLLLSVVTLWDAVIIPSVSGMLTADVSRAYGVGDVDRANSILKYATVLFIGLGIVALVGMALFAPVVSASGFYFTPLLRVLALSLLAAALQQVYILVLQSRLQFALMQMVKVTVRVSYLAGIVLFMVVFNMGLEGLVYAYTIAAWAPIIIFLPHALRTLSSFIGANVQWVTMTRELWQRAKWVLASDYTGAGMAALQPWLIGYFLSVEAIGVISVATLLLSQVTAFIPIAPVLRSVLPRTAEDPERLRVWLTRSMKYSLWAHMIGGITAFFALQIILPVFFPSYVVALPLFAVWLVTLGMRGLATVASEWYYSAQKQRDLFFVSTLPKLATFIILPLLLWGLGLWGFVVWYILASDVILLSRLRHIRKKSGITVSWRDITIPDAQDREILFNVARSVRARIPYIAK